MAFILWQGFGSNDRFLRETLFGAEHPLKSGRKGLLDFPDNIDTNLPGFGPLGTAGHHCFDPNSLVFLRIRELIDARAAFPALRFGRQYLRPISFLGKPFDIYSGGEIIAWSRILDDEEFLIVLNPHGTQVRGADIILNNSVKSTLNA